MSKGTTTHIKALSKVQKDLKHAKKDDKGAFGKYADLATVYDAIKAPLASNGFAYCHEMINTEDGTLYVETHLLHESGGSFKTRLPIINQKRDMQGLGSAITYAKRYGISMIVGLASEEDDNGKRAGTGDVNNSVKAKPISNLVIKTREGEGKVKSLDGGVMQFNSILKAQMEKYKGKELRETGEFMRKENAEILDKVKNNPAWISNGSNERWNQIDKKLKEMENTKDE